VALEENSSFRQMGNSGFARDALKGLTPQERRARKLGITYIPIGGRIGCLVNGAGLAMATMDLIARHGESPANFLDVGGGADLGQVQGAFELLFENPDLAAVFVNIFGGIMRCDLIAEALVKAHRRRPLRGPLVARLMGSRVEGAAALLKKENLPRVEVFSELEPAVTRVCALAKGADGTPHPPLRRAPGDAGPP